MSAGYSPPDGPLPTSLAGGGPPGLIYYSVYEPLVATGSAVRPEGTFLEGSYATVEDLDEIVVAENAGHDYSPRSKRRWLRVASRLADSYLGQRFKVPLVAWSDAWIWAVCEIAYAGLTGKRGHDPEAKTEKTLDAREKKAMDWIRAARDYEITPDPRLVLTETFAVATMVSDAPRGWSGSGRARRGRGFF